MFTERPTAHTAPALRSIQITIRSSLPASSTALIVRSANLPAFELRRIRQEYGRDAQPFQRPPQPVLVPLRALVVGGTCGGLHHPRARARADAAGDPRRPLRPQPALAAAAGPVARPRRHHPRDRPGHRRLGAGLAAGRLEPRPDAALPRALQRGSADGHVPRGEAVRFEQDDVAVRLTTRQRARDDLLQLVHLEPVQHAVFDGLDQVARLEPCVVDGVATDERRALENRVVELSLRWMVGADRAYECALA